MTPYYASLNSLRGRSPLLKSNTHDLGQAGLANDSIGPHLALASSCGRIRNAINFLPTESLA